MSPSRTSSGRRQLPMQGGVLRLSHRLRTEVHYSRRNYLLFGPIRSVYDCTLAQSKDTAQFLDGFWGQVFEIMFGTHSPGSRIVPLTTAHQPAGHSLADKIELGCLIHLLPLHSTRICDV